MIINPIQKITSIPNFAFGFQSEVLILELNHHVDNALLLNEEVAELIQKRYINLYLNSKEYFEKSFKSNELSDHLILWASIFQRSVGLSIFEKGLEIKNPKITNKLVAIPSPLLAHKTLADGLNWLSKILLESKESFEAASFDINVKKLNEALKKFSTAGSNVPLFKEAAYNLNIPVITVEESRVLQYGQGKNSRWMNSSFTNRTPHIGSTIAKNKHWCSKVLFNAGLPVASHVIVKSGEQAISVADKMGYPVVIKPIALDGGLGVAAGLRRPDEVIKAFNEASKYKVPIMLQKHFFGRDYRLSIFEGKVLWAIERQPASVVGDGIHTVQELVDIVNLDPKRGDGEHATLKKIILDEEAISLIQESNKSIGTVLKVDESLQLRRRANISAGGMPISVMGKVHVDNERLAIRAAELLELDLAGVDLLIPDISKSWMEVGAVICEVNSQPTLGSLTSRHVYKEVLSKLVPGNGRIPISIIMGYSESKDADQTFEKYSNQGLVCGYVSRNGLFIGDEKISNCLTSSFHGAKSLIMDKRVEALVVDVTDFSFVKLGTPFDRIDEFIYSNVDQMSSVSSISKANELYLRQVLMMESILKVQVA